MRSKGSAPGTTGPWYVATNLVAAVIVVAVAALAVAGVASGPVVTLSALTAAVLAAGIHFRDFVTHERRPRRWVVVTWLVALLGVGMTTVGLVVGPDRAGNGVLRITGGCEPFMVYGQNRWAPVGAKVLAEPYSAAKRLTGVAPNKIVYVDGWVRTEIAQPSKRGNPPWDSDVWFHLKDDEGWVSFAGVRARPTTLDPTGFEADGGAPAVTIPSCQAALR